jgi:hypothetical protein
MKQIRYISFPEYYQTMGKYRSLRAKRDKAGILLAKKFHSSKYRFLHEILPFLKFIFNEDPPKGAEIAAWLDLSIDDLLTFLPERVVNLIIPHFEQAKEKVNASRIRVREVDHSPFFDDQMNAPLETITEPPSESKIIDQKDNDQEIVSDIKSKVISEDTSEEKNDETEETKENEDKDSQTTLDEFFL